MLELLWMGGTLFMSILTIIFVRMIAVAFVTGLPLLKEAPTSKEEAARKISYIKQVGLFALVVGILGQLIGLFEAFKYIEIAKDISPAMMAGGIKVSMITTLYGFLIYVISFLIWFGLSFKLK
ncbi:MAG: MotA/TolQ/ExbB proton channel family protein [Cyclobacteriaceae bacterium]